MDTFTGARAKAVALSAASALWLATAAAQEGGIAAPYRTMLAQVTAPAIDRGPRDNDAPGPARTSRDRRITRSGNADRPYLSGSVIVKFRPGTSPGAQRAMLAL